MAPTDPHPSESRARPFLYAVAWVAIGVLVIGLAGTILAIRDTQTQNTTTLHNTEDAANSAEEAARASKRSADLIEDCVTPGGKCKQRGERATAKAVGEIGAGFREVSIHAAACAATEARRPDVATLTADELAGRIEECLNQLASTSRN